MQQKLFILQSELQLANERKRTVTQTAAETTQMVEIAQERAAKATERERKFRVESIKVKEMAARALE